MKYLVVVQADYDAMNGKASARPDGRSQRARNLVG